MFFVRIAELSDQAKSEEEKKSLSALAENLVNTLEVIVQRTEERVDSASELLQGILKTAAEEDGEFMVPLSAAKAQATRQAVLDNKSVMDDSFLSTVNAWMRKCSDDENMQGMVTILQQVLQLYASTMLISDASITSDVAATSSTELLDKIFVTNPDSWDGLLRESLVGDLAVTSSDLLLAEVQSRIETIVLAQEAGSYAQRVQAEFLRELSARIQSIAPMDVVQE
eukprot:FR734809.1.p1 GENE.FR734809.1~~FR734809.1.p1  ORF type:complete len:226 (+),score=34.61 FR734809.1:2-679(+)